MSSDLAAVVEKAIEAYNAQDFDAYQEFFVEDLRFCHHNRGFEFADRAAFVDTLKMFAKDLVPDRLLGPAVRVTQNGNVVVREQAWNATAVADIPGIASAGETFSLDLCSVFVFDGDRVCEYHDYG